MDAASKWVGMWKAQLQVWQAQKVMNVTGLDAVHEGGREAWM